MKARTAMTALLVAGGAWRAAFAVSFLRHPLSAVVPQDTDAYWTLARAIAAGDLRHPAFAYLSPLYAFVLAPLVALPPATAHALVAALQVALDTGTIALVAYVARELFGTRAGLAAAALYAAYGLAIYYAAVVLPVTLMIALTAVFVAALVRGREGTPLQALASGGTLGLLALVRPNAVVLLPIAAAWVLQRNRADSSARRRAAALAAGSLLVLLPWSVRAHAVGLGWSPFPVNGGINFYIGNHADANGMYVSVPNVSDLPLQQVTTSVEEAERRSGHSMDVRAASRFWWRAGLDFLQGQPAAAARLTAHKAALFLRAEEIPLNINYAFARSRLAVLRPTLGFGVLLPLAAAGLVALWLPPLAGSRADPLLLAASATVYAASVVAFFVSDRYRAPVVPLLAVLAGHGLLRLWPAKHEPRRGAVTSTAVLVVSAALVNGPFAAFRYPEYAKDYFELGRVHRDRGELAAAVDLYRKAAELSPEVPEALVELATTYHIAGRPLEAEMTLRRALAMDAGSSPARRNLSLLYKEQGLYAEALRFAADDAQRASVRRAEEDLRRRNGDAAAYARGQYELGLRLYGERRLVDARYAFLRAAAEADAGDATYFALALVSKDLRLREDACAAVQKAAALAPADPEYAAERAALCGPH
jgi:4-amino-4-deoxy-L-arabinose transferase-like glycosyltransferase